MDISFGGGGEGGYPSTVQLPNENFDHCTQMTQSIFIILG